MLRNSHVCNFIRYFFKKRKKYQMQWDVSAGKMEQNSVFFPAY